MLVLLSEIALAALIAGALDTVVGFGGLLLLLPVLVLAVGSRDAVLLSALISLGWNVVRLLFVGSFVKWRAVVLMALGIIPGAIIGGQFFGSVDPDLLRRGIGLLLIVLGGYYVLRLYIDIPGPKGIRDWVFPLVGVASGALSALLGAGNGPLQSWSLAAASFTPREIVASNGAIGGLTALSRLLGYALAGELHSGLWLAGTIGIVAAGIGAVLGIRISRRAKDSTLELVLGIAIVVTGVRMLM